jgi:hypothetical protein
MGKFLTSLLVLSASLLLPNEVFADEQVRRVQEELRKRHLFYAEPNGEKGAALTVALKHYQAKKGFAPTGLIDPGTLASLGLSGNPPSAAITPAIVLKRGELRGANGEQLPSGPSRGRPNADESDRLSAAGLIGRDYVQLELGEFARQSDRSPGTFGDARRVTNSFDEGGGSTFEVTFGPPARNRAANPNLVWETLALQGDSEISGLPGELNVKRLDYRSAPDRHWRRRPSQSRLRKERNPLVLTYQSLDRAMRFFFGDSHGKKKRSIAKRL